ncbi:hypothetical protein GH714_013419 [Hevea brasiliensis]|uniref:SMAX1-like nucleotide binding domain-containing protein n=1 Tax=Hevea brasiliensis TaxID=3981 RepID=A0A6A6N3G3_HEVBR|nr:hypothetical protein GH714_013419 [Hevea brasiliensis]
MPTPVSRARQFLTPEAAHALDEAVNVARRRGHGQTTSLHAISALISLPLPFYVTLVPVLGTRPTRLAFNSKRLSFALVFHLTEFPFPFSDFTGSFNGDENCRRIGEVLVRNKGRNPLLVGICAYDTLANFSEVMEKRKENILPVELTGLTVTCIQSDITKFISENFDIGCVDLRFEEVGRSVEQNLGPGLVVNLGDLKVFVNSDDGNSSGNGSSDSVTYVVEKLTRLLQLHGRKVWFMGATASCEGYLKFVSRFPSIEKDWDLQLLPIISFRNSMAESYPRSSLMESFVPFGGFFSTSSELESSLSSSYPCMSRCHMCNEKCEQEVLAVSKGGFVASVADQYQSNLSSWLKMAELDTNKGLDGKTRDGVVLSVNTAGLQKKWDSICWLLNHTQSAGSNTHPSHFPTVAGFQLVEGKKEVAEKCSSNSTIAPPNESSRASPSFVTSVTTHLGLRISPVSTKNELKKPVNKNHTELPLELTGSLMMNIDVGNGSISDYLAESSSPSSSLDFGWQFDPGSFKMLLRALTEKVSWQDEALHVISETIARCRTRYERSQGTTLRQDIWFNFHGPDSCDKADVRAQNCLSHAIRTGRISLPILKRILRVQGQPMQMLIEQASADNMGQILNLSITKRKAISSTILVNKRMIISKNQNPGQHEISEVVKQTPRNLDLSLPAKENDEQGTDDGNSNNDSMSDNSKAWLQDFFDQVDRIVVFKPFDFDAFAERLFDRDQ